MLVVDDDDDIRESLMDFLEEHGFEPLGARDGLDAFDKLGTADPQPCLIILDLMMPKMDGRTFRHKQLERASLAEIPVVVISAYRDVEQNARDLQRRQLAAQAAEPAGAAAGRPRSLRRRLTDGRAAT